MNEHLCANWMSHCILWILANRCHLRWAYKLDARLCQNRQFHVLAATIAWKDFRPKSSCGGFWLSNATQSTKQVSTTIKVQSFVDLMAWSHQKITLPQDTQEKEYHPNTQCPTLWICETHHARLRNRCLCQVRPLVSYDGDVSMGQVPPTGGFSK